MASEELEFIKINGGTALLYGKYRYHRHKIYKNSSVVWRCSSYFTSKCCGTLTVVEDKTIIAKKDHTCEVDEHKNQMLKQVCDLRETVISSDEPIQRLYDKKSNEFRDKGLNIAMGCLPPYESVKHFLNDAGNKSAHISKTVFKNVGEVEVPGQFKDFLLADYNHEQAEEQTRILVFCSNKSRKMIPNIKEYFVDGTLYSCPAPFAYLMILLEKSKCSYCTIKLP